MEYVTRMILKLSFKLLLSYLLATRFIHLAQHAKAILPS
jgi:hypothetical protein